MSAKRDWMTTPIVRAHDDTGWGQWRRSFIAPPAAVSTPPVGSNLKTHCRNGHEFDDRNTAIRTDGKRRCRQCVALRNRQWRTRRRSREQVARDGRCVEGHAFTPENTYVDPSGCKRCRECRASGMRAKRSA